MAYTCENSTREAEPRQGEVGLSVLRSKKTVLFGFGLFERDGQRVGRCQQWPVAGAGLINFYVCWLFVLSKTMIFKIEHIQQMSTRRN